MITSIIVAYSAHAMLPRLPGPSLNDVRLLVFELRALRPSVISQGKSSHSPRKFYFHSHAMP